MVSASRTYLNHDGTHRRENIPGKNNNRRYQTKRLTPAGNCGIIALATEQECLLSRSFLLYACVLARFWKTYLRNPCLGAVTRFVANQLYWRKQVVSSFLFAFGYYPTAKTSQQCSERRSIESYDMYCFPEGLKQHI